MASGIVELPAARKLGNLPPTAGCRPLPFLGLLCRNKLDLPQLALCNQLLGESKASIEMALITDLNFQTCFLGLFHNRTGMLRFAHHGLFRQNMKPAVEPCHDLFEMQRVRCVNLDRVQLHRFQHFAPIAERRGFRQFRVAFLESLQGGFIGIAQRDDLSIRHSRNTIGMAV
ncbi:MAG: hypothetical protein BWY06_02152 [Candidatus Latescibacteria bacterium ADurb.Bin168]|nr:MAG: hypothetical protein BWY06_02152 [Candidatus Latescibacteria bacterium ADurb.Bin168]